MADVQVLARTLPSGFCPATYQEMLNGFSTHQYVQIDTSTISLIASTTKPIITTVAWLQLDQLGRPVRIYYFAVGAWLSLHPQPPGFVMPWFDAVPTFSSFDGGDAQIESQYSGPMWEEIVDTDIVARFPLAKGTLASGTIIAQGDTGGEEKHILELEEMPAHVHNVTTGPTVGNDDKGPNVTSGSAPVEPPNPIIDLPEDVMGGDEDENTVAHNNMPPYRGMCWLRRTSRMFYVVP